MSGKRKNARFPAHYKRQLLQFVDEYIAETGVETVDLRLVAGWAYHKGLWEPPKRDVIKQLAKELSRASQEDYFEDDNGEPVRHRHAYRIVMGDEQQTLWVKIEDATREQMRLSSQQRRKGILGDCLQLNRDVKHYNTHHNPGDPLTPSFDFTPDLAEKEQSSEYHDTPPEESDDNAEPDGSSET